MRSTWAFLVATAALLAGCAGDDASTATAGDGESLDASIVPSTPGALAPGALSAAVAPVWNVGDAWAATTYGGDNERPFFAVVTAASGDSYTLGVTDEPTAGFEAMFDVSWVGKIRASDLAGHQQDQPVQYFSFPLEDGKTWTAKWDGRDVALTATASQRGFDIVGTVDGEPYVTYDFVPELKWWSRLDFPQDDFGIRVDRFVANWTGTLVSAEAKLLYEAGPTAPILSSGTGSFTMDEGQTFGLVTLQGRADAFARAFALTDPTGNLHMSENIENFEFVGEPSGMYRQEPLPPTPGTWHVASKVAHDPAGAFRLTVHQIALQTAQFP